MPGSRPGGATRGTTARATTAPRTSAPIRAAIDEGFDIWKFSFGGRRAWGASRLGAVAPRQHHERGGSPALWGLIARGLIAAALRERRRHPPETSRGQPAGAGRSAAGPPPAWSPPRAADRKSVV